MPSVSSRGVCVCVGGRGAGRVGAFMAPSRQRLLPEHTQAAATQGHSPAARWTFTLLCKQAGT